MTIGVLALQGDFKEHIVKLSGMNVPSVEVRLPGELEGLSGLIIPGGESTTFRKLALAYGLIEPLRRFARIHAVWGTCAGAIALARDIGSERPFLGLMDIVVARNYFGRQLDSFEADLDFPALTPPRIHAVFIRAPAILSVDPGVEVLARLEDGTIVAAREKRWLATCFHPELTGDDRLHRLFVNMTDGPQ
jgi:5'-phosphate synthase pdxT subunit